MTAHRRPLRVRFRLAAAPALLLVACLAAFSGQAQAVSIDLEPETQTQAAAPGTNASFNLTLRNTGAATVTVTLSHSTPPGNWTVAWNQTSYTLDANQTVEPSLTITVDGGAIPGTNHTFTLTAQTTGNVSQDSVTVRVNVESPGIPDLEILTLGLDPADPAPGIDGIATARVRNRGDGPSPPTLLRFRLDDNATLSMVEVPPLQVDEHADLESDPWSTTGGSHVLEAFVDPGAAMAESNESNNARSLAFVVAAPSTTATDPGPQATSTPPPRLELAVDGESRSGAPGGNLTFGVTVRRHEGGTDVVTLRVEASGTAWTFGLGADRFTIADNGQVHTVFWVQLPADATPGSGAVFTLEAASTQEPTLLARLTLRAAVAVPEPGLSTPLVVGSTILVAGGAAVGLGFALHEGLRYRWFLWMASLFARFRGDQLLDHDMRRRIHETIRTTPGIHYGALKRTLELNNGALTHHLAMLERQSLVVSRRDGLRKRFFPRGAPPAPPTGPSGLQRAILDLVHARPGISQSELRHVLATSKQLVNYHVHALARGGALRIERMGRDVRCHPAAQELPRIPPPSR